MKTKERDTKALQRPETGFFDEMDRAFDSLLTRGWMRPFREYWPEWAPVQPDLNVRVPRIDLVERDNEYLVRAELPGIAKENLHLDLSGDMLTIRGERRHKETTEEGNVYRAEILHGAFSRTIRLPSGINPETVEANFDNGMLEVHLPKQEASKRQTIEIK